MGKIKTLVALGLASTLVSPSFFAKNNLEKRIDYEIRCSVFHVGDGYYQLNEGDGKYSIRIKAWPTSFFKFLGLKYEFSTEGHKEGEDLYPDHFYRMNQSTEVVDNESVKKIEITDIDFDYENLEAKAYAYALIDGEKKVKYDTRNNPEKITREVKDFLTLMEEFQRKELKDVYDLKTIAKGKINSFQIRKIGEETIEIDKEYYNTVVYETEVDEDLFDLDSKVRFWVHKNPDHTILKCWIENGPLWTSITLEYDGKKSWLR